MSATVNALTRAEMIALVATGGPPPTAEQRALLADLWRQATEPCRPDPRRAPSAAAATISARRVA